MEPSEENKRDILRAIAQHLGQGLKPKPAKEPLGVFDIPEAYIEEILALASDDIRESRSRHNKMWRRIHEIMPATREYQCTLDVSNATQPSIRLVEYTPNCAIETGKRDIEQAHHVPAAHKDEIEGLADIDDEKSTPLSRYRLWSRINAVLPAVGRQSTDIKWRIYISPEELCVFKYTEEREQREESKRSSPFIVNAVEEEDDTDD